MLVPPFLRALVFPGFFRAVVLPALPAPLLAPAFLLTVPVRPFFGPGLVLAFFPARVVPRKPGRKSGFVVGMVLTFLPVLEPSFVVGLALRAMPGPGGGPGFLAGVS